MARSPIASYFAFPDAYPKVCAVSGTSFGTAICGIAGGSCLRKPSTRRLMGRMYSPWLSKMGLCLPTSWQVLEMAASAFVTV